MFVGNVISKYDIEVDQNINLVTNYDDIIEDLPTLIVGWSETSKIFPDQDIMDKKINDDFFWTYSKMEKRSDFEVDLDIFTKFAYEKFVSNVFYVFIDPIQYKLKKIKKILYKINSSNNITSYVNKEMAYICVDNLIFGVNLELLSYIGLNRDKIIIKIKEKSHNFLDSEDILIEYKGYIKKLNNEVKYIPYLYSLSNNE